MTEEELQQAIEKSLAEWIYNYSRTEEFKNLVRNELRRQVNNVYLGRQ